MSESILFQIEIPGLTSGNNPVVATETHIAFGNNTIPWQDISGLRFFRANAGKSFPDGGPKYQYHIDLMLEDKREFSNVIRSSGSGISAAEGNFNALRNLLRTKVRIRLRDNYLRELQSESTLQIGETEFTKAGLMLMAPGLIFRKPTTIPWQFVIALQENDLLTIKDKRNPKIRSEINLRTTWNAEILVELIKFHLKDE